HTDCPLTDFGGKTSIFSHPVYLFLRKFSLQDSRGGSARLKNLGVEEVVAKVFDVNEPLSQINQAKLA
ncbi:YdhR family protein, partial [Escherichia sp. WS1860]|uniref:YdhR family protein n=1 Tax=Escherichia sp. WS1860 TaxID=3381951 RepID=UPI00396F4795